MAKQSISVCKGKGSLGHNNREFSTPNVDPTRTHLNIIYKQEPLAEAYEKLFGEEVRRYNEGKKPSRQIPDYMEKIRNSKNGEKLFYETVVQVGNRYTCSTLSQDGETAKKILDDYMKDFQNRNPNLYVFNAVLHFDEPDGTPHLHIDWIPVAHGYKQGLQVRNSLDKALKEQGIDGATSRVGHSTHNWQEAEKNAVERVMERYGWERAEESGLGRKHLTVDQYKAVASEIENQIAVLPEQITAKPVPMSKDKVVVSKADLEALEKRAKLSIVHEEATKSMEDKVLERSEAHMGYIQKHEDNMKDRELALLKKEGEYHFAAKEYKQMKIDLLAEVSSKKKKYEGLYQEQIGLNHAYNKLKSVVAEQDKTIANLEKENTSLRGQIADLRAEISQKIQEAIQPFKDEIEALKTKMKDIALGEATLLKAVKYVAKHFSGEVSEAILRATYQKGDEWLKHDGFEEMSGFEAGLPKSITAKMDMKLTFMDGDEGRGVYSPRGTCVANVKTIKEAREMFPNSQIDNKVKTQTLVR